MGESDLNSKFKEYLTKKFKEFIEYVNNNKDIVEQEIPDDEKRKNFYSFLERFKGSSWTFDDYKTLCTYNCGIEFNSKYFRDFSVKFNPQSPYDVHLYRMNHTVNELWKFLELLKNFDKISGNYQNISDEDKSFLNNFYNDFISNVNSEKKLKLIDLYTSYYEIIHKLQTEKYDNFLTFPPSSENNFLRFLRDVGVFDVDSYYVQLLMTSGLYADLQKELDELVEKLRKENIEPEEEIKEENTTLTDESKPEEVITESMEQVISFVDLFKNTLEIAQKLNLSVNVSSKLIQYTNKLINSIKENDNDSFKENYNEFYNFIKSNDMLKNTNIQENLSFDDMKELLLNNKIIKEEDIKQQIDNSKGKNTNTNTNTYSNNTNSKNDSGVNLEEFLTSDGVLDRIPSIEPKIKKVLLDYYKKNLIDFIKKGDYSSALACLEELNQYLKEKSLSEHFNTKLDMTTKNKLMDLHKKLGETVSDIGNVDAEDGETRAETEEEEITTDIDDIIITENPKIIRNKIINKRKKRISKKKKLLILNLGITKIVFGGIIVGTKTGTSFFLSNLVKINDKIWDRIYDKTGNYDSNLQKILDKINENLEKSIEKSKSNKFNLFSSGKNDLAFVFKDVDLLTTFSSKYVKKYKDEIKNLKKMDITTDEWEKEFRDIENRIFSDMAIKDSERELLNKQLDSLFIKRHKSIIRTKFNEIRTEEELNMLRESLYSDYSHLSTKDPDVYNSIIKYIYEYSQKRKARVKIYNVFKNRNDKKINKKSIKFNIDNVESFEELDALYERLLSKLSEQYEEENPKLFEEYKTFARIAYSSKYAKMSRKSRKTEKSIKKVPKMMDNNLDTESINSVIEDIKNYFTGEAKEKKLSELKEKIVEEYQKFLDLILSNDNISIEDVISNIKYWSLELENISIFNEEDTEKINKISNDCIREKTERYIRFKLWNEPLNEPDDVTFESLENTKNNIKDSIEDLDLNNKDYFFHYLDTEYEKARNYLGKIGISEITSEPDDPVIPADETESKKVSEYKEKIENLKDYEEYSDLWDEIEEDIELDEKQKDLLKELIDIKFYELFRKACEDSISQAESIEDLEELMNNINSCIEESLLSEEQEELKGYVQELFDSKNRELKAVAKGRTK